MYCIFYENGWSIACEVWQLIDATLSYLESPVMATFYMADPQDALEMACYFYKPTVQNLVCIHE